ncbi:MAG: hypothetical protein AB4911_03815 [Oscillochloridaceae bacterium umkhey_bin13]
MPTLLVAYDRRAVYALLRVWTPQQLGAELRTWRSERWLDPNQASELQVIVRAWEQRALGMVTLRDVLLIDPQRGRRAFDLICAAHTVARLALSPRLAAYLGSPGPLTELPAPLCERHDLAALNQRVANEGLALAALTTDGAYPFPDDLNALTPPPTGDPYGVVSFEQPTGWRRRIAILLAGLGVVLLVIPILLGRIPDDPARLPLALLTLALLIGIRAGRAGWLGSLCIWLVANLPGFRHGLAPLATLWPGLPMLIVGVILLTLDRRIRAMWRWLRQQVFG